MTAQRPAELQQFVAALKTAFAAAPKHSPDARLFSAKLFAALATEARGGGKQPAMLPVCSHLPMAIQTARSYSPEVAGLAAAFEALAHRLTWKLRTTGGPHASANWPGGHANAMIIGQGGLEERSDISVGVSLLAPNVRYPDHNHPPEEFYILLTPGRFQHGDDDWCELRAGDTFHNTPAIKHAMASGSAPLLAVWTLISD